MNDEGKKVPQVVLDAMKSAEDAKARVAERIKIMAPMLLAFEKLKTSTLNSPGPMELKLGYPIEVVREQNNWERHAEILDVQNALLQAQQEILRDQRSGKKFVITGLVLSGVAAIFAAIAIIPVLPQLGEWFGW